MLRWENPEIFWLLWFLPFYWLIMLWFWRQNRKRLRKVLGSRLEPFLTSSVSTKRRKIHLILRSLTLIAAIGAWARPQAGQSKQEVKSEGVELIMAVDVSDSMLAEDLKPSRLEQAKLELARLLDSLPGHKVGIVAFAGSAALMSPLSSDPAALKMYLESLSTFSVSAQGTNFKAALEESFQAFERGGIVADGRTVVTRVILIASDGEDHEVGALDLAKDLVKKGIRIFSMAYGTSRGGQIPERDSMGFLRGHRKDQAGNPVITTVNGAALLEMSKAGQGSFYHASIGGTHLNSLVEDISKLEKTQFDSQMAVQYDEKFQWLLSIAILFLLCELLISDRRPDFKLWRGRYEIPPA